MSQSQARARVVEEAGRQYLWFWCAGCQTHHDCRIRVADGARPSWAWNGSVERPTLTPSVLVRVNPPGHRHYQPQAASSVCHSFVTDGRIQYLSDSTHALAGQTVDLEPIAESMGEA